jgi:hypothetical protein
MPVFRRGAHLSMTLVTTVAEFDPMPPRESRLAMSFSLPRLCSGFVGSGLKSSEAQVQPATGQLA